MKTFIQSDQTVVAIAPYDMVSGQFAVAAGNLYGVAVNDALSGAEVVLNREGVYSLAKLTGTAWTQGDVLYWDASAKKFTKVAAGNKQIGVAFADAASGDATGQVSIEEVPGGIVNALAGVGAGYKIARGGAAALDGSNPTPIATGLTTIVAAFVQLRGTAAPGDNTSVLTTDFTGSDGTLNVYAWKNTSGSDPTLVASTGTETFDWIAVGT